jgi:predicted phosphodiesterase
VTEKKEELDLSEIKKLEQWLRKNNFDPNEAKEMLKLIRNEKARGYSTFSHSFSGRHVKIGALGDSHFGNKWTDKTYLNDVMKHYRKEGVEAVYYTGDMTDGPWQRHKNVLEQYAHGFDNQVNDFVEDFPDTKVPVYLIDGNHDGWYRQGEGAVVGAAIAKRRDDINYLGHDEALVKMGKIEMMLSHPDDGSAYAYSYKPQKMIESMVKMGEKMPDIILQGHYHKIFQMQFAGVHYFCTGTTERQTPWMRGKKIAADMGAWVLDIYRDSHGNLTRLVSELLPYRGDTHSQTIGVK